MSSWRLLFDTVLLHLLPAARRSPVTQSEERWQMASLGMKEAATVLIEAELTDHRDADLMWRHWADFASRVGQPIDPAQRVRDELTVVVLAYLTSRATDGPRGAPDAERARRVTHLVSRSLDDRSFARVVSELMQSPDTSVPVALWDEMARRDLPERQVVFVQSLQTAVARLVILRLELRGGLPSSVGEWIAAVDDTEFQALWSDVESIALETKEGLLTPKESVVEQFSNLRHMGRRAEAQRLSRGAVSLQRLTTFHAAFASRWREARDVAVLLDSAGSTVVEDEPMEQTLTATVSRGFFVAGTNFIGEDTIAVGMADQIIRNEVEAVVHLWATTQASPSDAPELLEALELSTDDGSGWLLVSPIDWSGDQWREKMLKTRFPNLANYTSGLLSDTAVLLVNAAAQVWHIGRTDPPLVDIVELPLDENAGAAQVELQVRYAVPRGEGQAIGRMFDAPWIRDV